MMLQRPKGRQQSVLLAQTIKMCGIPVLFFPFAFFFRLFAGVSFLGTSLITHHRHASAFELGREQLPYISCYHIIQVLRTSAIRIPHSIVSRYPATQHTRKKVLSLSHWWCSKSRGAPTSKPPTVQLVIGARTNVRVGASITKQCFP